MIILLSLALALLLDPLAQAQTYKVIHSFTGGQDGSYPEAGLSLDRAGNLYGTAELGGAYTLGACGNDSGCGTVFKVAHKGSGWLLSTLYNFKGGSDGALPFARVVFGPDGNLYGTTLVGGGGGKGLCIGFGFGSDGCGTVFKLSPPASFCESANCPWVETMLHPFDGTDGDGALPTNEVVFDQAGNLYGTTAFGGSSGQCFGYRVFGCGNVFELTPSKGTWTETVLYDFLFNGQDGITPYANLIFDSAGNLYGTTFGGGPYGEGIVFELTPSVSGWTENILYNFNGVEGGQSGAGLIFDALGNLYGTTRTGGPGNGGTVFELFKMGAGWKHSSVANFSNYGNGPQSNLLMDAAGNLYGTSYLSGANGKGQVFKLSPGNGGWTFTSLHDFTGGSDGEFPACSLVMDASGNLYGTASDGGAYGKGVVFEITP